MESGLPIETMLWRRHDIPGHEACRLLSIGDGWRLEGAATLLHGGTPCCLNYEIVCDASWRTRSALVHGWVGEESIRKEVEVRDDGAWVLNGEPCEGVAGSVDVDLNFSPSTNLLPIRRFSLAIGESREVQAAWLRFPGFTLEPLVQTYERTAKNGYRYTSAGGRFVAELETTPAGFVLNYGQFWTAE